MNIANPSNSNPNLNPPDRDEGKNVEGVEGTGVAEGMVDNVNNTSTNKTKTNNVGHPTPTDINAYLTLAGEVLRNETVDPWERSEPTPVEQEMFDPHDEFVAELWGEIGKERGYGRTVEEEAVGGSAKMGVLGRIMPAIFRILTVATVMLTVWQIFHWFKKNSGYWL